MISKMEKTINGHNQGMNELESESAMQKGLEGKIGKQRSKEEDGDDEEVEKDRTYELLQKTATKVIPSEVQTSD